MVGRTTRGEHAIDTGTARPIATPLRQVAWVERDLIRDEVNKMKSQKIVIDSSSPWASPPVLVWKKDGTVRFCIDYRRLNEMTTPDQYPLPRIDDVLDALETGAYFSVIDLKSGYWQIPIKAEDGEKTAFRTADGLFQFTVMPFGLRNAPATFQRLMDVLLSGLKWNGLLVYMDDIIVYSASAQTYLALLEETLSRLAGAGLKINPKKTVLVAKEVTYLGHVVSAQGIKADPRKITAVQNIQPPQNITQVRAFLGLAGYYRRFIDRYAAITLPLTRLTKKGTEFQWGAEQQIAFDELKYRLMTAPILQYPKRDRPYIVDCDASNEAAGAVLMQKTKEGDEAVIQYTSYTFDDVERRWPIMEREAFAAVWAVQTFRPYILGSHFVIRTDNSAVASLKTAHQPKLQRWSLLLAEFSYEIAHRPGKMHSHVDALSRLPATRQATPVESLDDAPAVVATLGAVGAHPHPSLPLVDWKTAITEDGECAALRHVLAGRRDVPSPAMPKWFAAMSEQERGRFLLHQEGIIFRGFPPHDRPRWFVPLQLRRPLVAAFHSGAHGAHLGISRTAAQLGLRFYWPSMIDSVKHFIKACNRCQRAKAGPRIPRLSRMLNRRGLWTTVAFDFFGPLPRTARGHQYILVGIDHFSRWPEAVATRAATASTVADFMHSHVIAQHGTPGELLTDHGTHFTSHVIAELCRRYDVRRLMSTPYTPQSNGIVERFMGFLKGALTTMINRRPKS